MSLLPVYPEIFEKVIFSLLLKYLDDNNLLTSDQSSFLPGDFCLHRLLSMTHDIYKVLDTNPSLDVRGGEGGGGFWTYQWPWIEFGMMVLCNN